MRKINYLSALVGDATPHDRAAIISSPLLPILLSVICDCAQCQHNCFSMVAVACGVTVPIQQEETSGLR